MRKVPNSVRSHNKAFFADELMQRKHFPKEKQFPCVAMKAIDALASTWRVDIFSSSMQHVMECASVVAIAEVPVAARKQKRLIEQKRGDSSCSSRNSRRCRAAAGEPCSWNSFSLAARQLRFQTADESNVSKDDGASEDKNHSNIWRKHNRDHQDVHEHAEQRQTCRVQRTLYGCGDQEG